MNVIDPSFKHGKNLRIGQFIVIEQDVVVGDNVSIGHHSVLGEDVIIGSNVKIGNFCFLKSGSRLRNNIDFADYSKTTGICYLGNDVKVRTGSCISKSVIVEDKVFIGAGVMSSHTRFPAHGRSEKLKDMGRQYITRIGYGCLIGSRTNLGAGVEISDYTIVGYNSGVIKSIKEAGIYVGNPVKKIAEVPEKWIIPKPDDYEPYEFPKEKLKKYLPNYPL